MIRFRGKNCIELEWNKLIYYQGEEVRYNITEMDDSYIIIMNFPEGEGDLEILPKGLEGGEDHLNIVLIVSIVIASLILVAIAASVIFLVYLRPSGENKELTGFPKSERIQGSQVEETKIDKWIEGPNWKEEPTKKDSSSKSKIISGKIEILKK